MKFLDEWQSKLHARSINLIQQFKRSFLFKFLSILISFLLVRYLLKYLDVSDYGLWAVIISFLNWIIFFDLGIANGVKNKLSEAISRNDDKEARQYLSTGYVALAGFSSSIFLIVFFLSPYIEWDILFNTEKYDNEFLRTLVLIILFFTLSNFVLSLINAVFNAIQKASLQVANQFIFQLFALSIVLFLIQFTDSNLHYLAVGYGGSMFISNLSLSLWYYGKNKWLRPHWRYFDSNKLNPILSLGLRFFLLQITMMVILTTDRFILLQLTDTNEVTRYDVIYKYFHVLVVFHTLINSPLWAIYTEVYQKKDYLWIEKTMKNMIYLAGAYIVIIAFMVLAGDFVIKLWLNKGDLGLSISNYLFMGSLMLFSIVHSVLAYFTNGISKTNLQLLTSVIGAVINIPLSIFFVREFDMGLNGVILATIISLSLFCFSGPVQVIKEIRSLKAEAQRI